MIATDYKKLKAKGFVQLNVQADSVSIEYVRKQFDQFSGEEKLETRSDIITVEYLENLKSDLQSQIDEIDDMIKDIEAKASK